MQSAQPQWSDIAHQELNARSWFDTRVPDVNIITRYSSSSVTTGTVAAILLNGIGAGADDDQRTGRTIHMNQLTLRFTGTNEGRYFYVVYDKQANGAAPDLTYGEGNTFFTNNDSAAAWPTNAPQYLWPNDDNDGRLIWLATIRVSSENQLLTHTVDLQKLPVHYNGTGNTITAIVSGALYLVVAMSATSVVTRGWQLSYFDA